MALTGRRKDGLPEGEISLDRRKRFYMSVRTAIINPRTLLKPLLRLLLSSWTAFI